MVRLTAELISRSPQYLNAVKDREIDLRGNKIAAIENLAVTADQFDSIDLSDNEIVKLDNLPELKRLTTLLVSNNRISRIAPNIGEFVPMLQTLVLTNNRLINLWELDPLASLTKLQTLALLDNTVSKQPYYRLYVINKIPSLRLLDFSRVKSKEREDAKNKYSAPEDETMVDKAPEANVFVPGEAVVPMEDLSSRPSEAIKTAMKAALENANTLEEVQRLERAFQMGQLQGDVNIPGLDSQAASMEQG